MDHYFRSVDTTPAVNLVLQQGLYKILRNRIRRLYEVDNQKYDELTKNPIFNTRLDKILNHEKELFKTDTYDELAQAAAQEQIDFISNIPKEISIDKRGRALYFRMLGLEINKLGNFICNIPDNEVLLIIPFITVSNTIKDPYICLSAQFLICNNSDPILIYRFLSEQLNTAYDDYQINQENLAFNLYFKHKIVRLTHKEF